MRALWSLVVVCLVAATGVRQVHARTELDSTSIVRSAPSARALATRPAPHVVMGRSCAPALQLPPVVPATPFSLGIPPPRAVAQVSVVRDCVFGFLILTYAARGPPIA